ncbi:hypothetical protein HQO38_20065 [Rhodococcus fascians]|jgi:hypothetical protein|uniref:hypothetical protein n=1 Tax=Rhodococcoides fascians TaxID=1828 RepID=UPI00196046A8|nr:hypothetical protein [Rhodococcus fascians]MBM7245081.1 hypothetical protein [Rhodococcus fascians]MBX5333133.1 hypothetical protein [Rhodococcus fascians]MBY3811170.1 hypothetical protein [Rhodococcus fascians]MBY3842673.1 hypothetical protein [Rhodococcus fascians]MBY3845582.1 hypothetical protein [Rhodococcus fascians]
MDTWTVSAPYAAVFAVTLLWPPVMYAILDLKSKRSPIRVGVVTVHFVWSLTSTAWVTMSFFDWITAYSGGGRIALQMLFVVAIVTTACFFFTWLFTIIRNSGSKTSESTKTTKFPDMTWVPPSATRDRVEPVSAR